MADTLHCCIHRTEQQVQEQDMVLDLLGGAAHVHGRHVHMHDHVQQQVASGRCFWGVVSVFVGIISEGLVFSVTTSGVILPTGIIALIFPIRLIGNVFVCFDGCNIFVLAISCTGFTTGNKSIYFIKL